MQNYTSKGCVSIVPPIEGYDALTVLDTDYGGPCKNTSAALDVFNAGDVLAAGRKYMNIQVIDSATNWYYGVSFRRFHYVNGQEADRRTRVILFDSCPSILTKCVHSSR